MCSKPEDLCLVSGVSGNFRNDPLIPGLPDDLAEHCLALVPRSMFPCMGSVCKKWRFFIQSSELLIVRKLAGVIEEWIFFLSMDSSQWEIMDSFGHKLAVLPTMPGGSVRIGFGVVVLDGKLLVIGGYSMIDYSRIPSAEVYQYDSCLNSWTKLAGLNVARYDFACAEVNGRIYVVGGRGMDGENLSTVEMYDATGDHKWTFIESLRRPKWGCLAFGFKGKLYVMGGRSNFTIGYLKMVDVYNPQLRSWCESKTCLSMIMAHAEIGEKLFCIQWKNQRKLSVFNPEANTCDTVALPISGNSCSDGFQFGKIGGKLLLFSSSWQRDDAGRYGSFVYDPTAGSGLEWKTSEISPSAPCLLSVTISV